MMFQMNSLLAIIFAIVINKNYAAKSQDRVVSLGVGPKPSKFTTQNIKSAVFIDSSPVVNNGILFGVSAYLISNTTFHVQVWRLLSGKQYTLIYDFPLKSVGPLPSSQDITLATCTPLLAGDFIGMFFEKYPWPIPYNYDAIRLTTFQNFFDVQPLINTTYSMDTLPFPYVFSYSSWILNDASNDTSDWTGSCPSDVIIPVRSTSFVSSSTVRPQLTGAMGGTGNTGPQGPPGKIGPPGSTGPIGPEGEIGAPGSIGPIGLVGSTGLKGQMGATGVAGPIGSEGLIGPNGTMGAIGEMGPSGQPGPDAELLTTPIVKTENLKESDGNEWWRSESLLVGVYIWLALLSFLFLVGVVWAAVLCSKFNRLRRRSVAASKAELLNDS